MAGTGSKRRGGRRPAGDDSRRRRRALSNVGGAVERAGDPALCDLLARAARPPEDADPRTLTHGFHAWPARLHPHTARTLIQGSADGVICDPFMGGGTCAVEALLAGRQCHASDLNPVALEVAWARTRRWPDNLLRTLRARARDVVGRARRHRAGKPVDSRFAHAEGAWYDPPALAEVWSLAAVLAGSEDRVDRMLRVCLSSILVKVSRQASDSVVRRDRDHKYVARGRVERFFEERVEEHARNVAALRRKVPVDTPEPVLAVADARSPPPVDGVAAVITSPPYPGVYDYVGHHQRRYAALGLDAAAMRKGEIGSRRAQRNTKGEGATAEYTEAMSDALSFWPGRMSPAGRVFLIVGDGQRAEGSIDVVPIIEKAADGADMRIVARISQARPTFAIGKSSRPAKGGDRREHIFALEVRA